MAQNAAWYLRNAVGVLIRACLMVFFLWSAYTIRLFAIKSYGKVIHEFDPWSVSPSRHSSYLPASRLARWRSPCRFRT